MTWSLFTYVFGIPVSETHGLIGGLVGAAVAAAGLDVVQWQGLVKVLLAIIISPADIFASWLLTLPVTMALGALWALLLGGLFGALGR
jgi:inorganic phosphate transporter, PiT family